MGELGWNKIFGAILAAVLIIFGLREVSGIVFPSGAKHGGHHAEEVGEDPNEKFAAKYAYWLPVSDTAGGPAVEEIYDLGAMLAAADPAKGQRSMEAKCASCHNWQEGGPNGTGPGLWGVVSADIAVHPGFNYSGALRDREGNWDYAALDGFLENPARWAPGTAMSFAGLRRDDERANVIAYLASISPSAAAFPEPLPPVVEGEETDEGAEAGPIPEEVEMENAEILPPAAGEIDDAALGGQISGGFAGLGFDWMGLDIRGPVATLTGTAPTADAKAAAFSAGESAIKADPVAADRIDVIVDGIAIEGGDVGVGAALANIGAEATLEGCQTAFAETMSGRNIEFETGSATISADSARLLDALTGAAILCSAYNIEIGGHTDTRGADDANLALSQARATAVREYLLAKGVTTEKITAVGYGETTPLDAADTDEAHQRNRRTEFTLSTRE